MKLALPMLLLGLSMTIHSPTRAAEFPPPEQLPAREGFPDALVMLDGTAVKTAQQWRTQRRPELIRLFEHYMYGAVPAAAAKPQITATLESEHTVLDGKAKMKQVAIRYGPSPDKQQQIDLLLFTPTKVKGAPVFVGLSFGGNHTVFNDPRIKLSQAWMPSRYPGVKDNRATEASRGTNDSWQIEMAIDRGYAVATAYHGDIDPDNKDDWSNGVHALYYKPGQTQPGPHEWGTIAAWAWGLSRMADYLVTDDDVDGGRMIVIGHSRNGKTALLAGALDERFAIVIPSQAGCGGTAPSRSSVGESVERINTSFPHWFNDTFPQFNQATDKLPFDQHCLMALVAPRPLLLTNATGDQWANPTGQFQMLKLAEPVYRLLGVEGCGADEMPPENQLVNTRLGYFIRPGKHDMGAAEWQQWMDFADRHLPRKG